MKPLRIVHLLDDMAAGGVQQAISIYDNPALSALAQSEKMLVEPNGSIAPKIDADIIMTHFPPRWAAIPFLLALRARNRKARLVHVEHSYTRAWEANNVPDQARFRMMLRIAYSVFDHVVSVSEGQARWLWEAANLSSSKTSVIPPWSNPNGLEELAEPDWSPDRKIVIGAYGRFVECKGFDRLIAAFKQLDPDCYELHIGGFGEDEEHLRELAADSDNIHFKGRVCYLAGFLSECDMIAMPSRWEAFGLVATEARMAARPILVSDVDGLPEQAELGGCIVDFAEPDGLAHALGMMDDGILRQMSHEARQSVEGAQAQRIEAWQQLFTSVS